MEGDITKITHITLSESEKYIPYSEDLTGTPKRYYTLTPSTDPERPASQGWEDVTYYTNRRKHNTIPKGQTNCQWIYVLSDPLNPAAHKIGFTKDKDLTNRVKQINASTGVYEEYKLEWAFPCYNAHNLEKEIHKYLQDGGLRINKKKEFFYISLEQAKAVIERIGQPYRMDDTE